MSSYDDIVGQIEARNAARQEEWRAKALARRSRGGKKKQSYGMDEDGEEDPDVGELPAHRRRRRRNQHLIPGKNRLMREGGMSACTLSAPLKSRDNAAFV